MELKHTERPQPGVEPGTLCCEATVLTTTPPTLTFTEKIMAQYTGSHLHHKHFASRGAYKSQAFFFYKEGDNRVNNNYFFYSAKQRHFMFDLTAND